MINTMKGSFTKILSVTLLCLPTSWTCASPLTLHIQIQPQAYIDDDNDMRDGRTAARCCEVDLNNRYGGPCIPKKPLLCFNIVSLQTDSDGACFRFSPAPYIHKKGGSTYQSCTYSFADGYCTPQKDPCPS